MFGIGPILLLANNCHSLVGMNTRALPTLPLTVSAPNGSHIRHPLFYIKEIANGILYLKGYDQDFMSLLVGKKGFQCNYVRIETF